MVHNQYKHATADKEKLINQAMLSKYGNFFQDPQSNLNTIKNIAQDAMSKKRLNHPNP